MLSETSNKIADLIKFIVSIDQNMLLNINSEVREDLKKIAPAEKSNMSKKLFGVLNEK